MKIHQEPVTKRDTLRRIFAENNTIPSLDEVAKKTGIPKGTISAEMTTLRSMGWIFKVIGPNMGYVVIPPEDLPKKGKKKKLGRPRGTSNSNPVVEFQRATVKELIDLNKSVKACLLTIGVISAGVLAIALHLIINN